MKVRACIYFRRIITKNITSHQSSIILNTESKLLKYHVRIKNERGYTKYKKPIKNVKFL